MRQFVEIIREKIQILATHKLENTILSEAYVARF